MYQANQSFHIVVDDRDEFVPKGKVFADSHPIVRNAPLCFEKLDVGEEPTGEAPVKRGPGRPPKAAA